MNQPNILLLFTDQQRADTIAALGNPLIKTPTLDRLVREGTAFTRAYTPSPVCVAARFALTTGVAPHQSGVVDNCAFPAGHRSVMEVLGERGYQSHGSGKMHFCGGDPRRKWGFDSRDFSEEVVTDDDYNEFLRAKGYGHVVDAHGVRSEYYYLPQPSQLPAALHHTTWIADRSISFLRARDRSRPFFLWSSFIKPHPPFESPNPWSRLYRSAEMPDPVRPEGHEAQHTFWNRLQNRYKYMDGGYQPHLVRTQRAAYYGAISFIDFQLGRILAELGPELDNTLVVFSSDHGEMLGDFGCFGKRCMLEASARVPLIVRYPKSFAAGTKCDVPVSLLDLFPTFATAAGANDSQPSTLGADLGALARGAEERSHVFSQFSHRSLGLYLVAEREWKYIYSAADRRAWLFNTAADPREERNLVGAASARPHRDRLHAHFVRQFARDNYPWAIDERGEWRDYGGVELPADPRTGLLFQDPPELTAAIFGLEDYARPQPVTTDLLGATSPEKMDPATGRVKLPE